MISKKFSYESMLLSSSSSFSLISSSIFTARGPASIDAFIRSCFTAERKTRFFSPQEAIPLEFSIIASAAFAYSSADLITDTSFLSL
ncbi:MAG: hypothetical protein H7A26_07945 [Spirochaetales bacterium]|nr:hypothetical protein [Spirochaetales bacterium]